MDCLWIYNGFKTRVLGQLSSMRYAINKNISQMDLENVTVKEEMYAAAQDMLAAIDQATADINALCFRSYML
jgi:hypothetical protein